MLGLFSGVVSSSDEITGYFLFVDLSADANACSISFCHTLFLIFLHVDDDYNAPLVWWLCQCCVLR